MKKIVLISSLKWLFGTFFIFSGLIKANDPVGLSYKMMEFYAAFHLDQWTAYALHFSVTIISLEIVLGIALIYGFFPRITTRMLLGLNAFFLFLTGYAAFSEKIKTCGCLGDCFPISALLSFVKDMLLVFLSAVLVKNYYYIRAFFTLKTNLILCFWTFVASILTCLNSIYNLPILDCLPFKKGVNLRETIAANDKIAEEIAIWFYYQKDGKEVIIKNNKFPEDFGDTYLFIKREEHAPSQEKKIDLNLKEFHLSDANGHSVEQNLLQLPHCSILFLHSMNDASLEKIHEKILRDKHKLATPLYIASSLPAEVLERIFRDLVLQKDITLLRCDNTLIKTIARADATLYIFESGVIKDKQAF